MLDIIDKMNDKERTQLVKYCDKLDKYNCGWVDFGLKDIVAENAALKTVDKSKLQKKYRPFWHDNKTA
jgi:hypothetical protein